MIRRHLIGTAILVTSLALLVAIVPVLLDLNRYKPELSHWLKTRLGCDIDFAGKIEWKIFPELSISAANITVENLTGVTERPILVIEKFETQFEYLPLLHWVLSIKTLNIDGFTLNLSVDEKGAGIWENLTANSRAFQKETTPKEITAFDKLRSMTALVEGLSLMNGRINWENRRTDVQLFFKNTQINIQRWGNKGDFEIEFFTAITRPSKALVGNVKLTTKMGYDSRMPQLIFYDSRVNLTGFDALAPYRLPEVTINAQKSTFNWAHDALQISGLDLESRLFKMTMADIDGDRLMAQPNLKTSVEILIFDPKAMLKSLGIQPELRSSESLASASAAFYLHANRDKLNVSGLNLAVDNTHAKGWLTIENFKNPQFKFDLTADKLNLDRYINVSENTHYPDAVFSQLSGSIRTEAPLTKLKNLQADGELKVKELSIKDVVMNDVCFQIKTDKWRLQVRQASLKLK